MVCLSTWNYAPPALVLILALISYPVPCLVSPKSIEKESLWPSFLPITRSWALYFCLSEDTADLDRFLGTIWFSSVQSSVVSDSATPWTAACQASLSITNSQSLLKLMSIELVVPSSHLILCYLIRINIIPLTAGFSLANWVPWRRCWPCAGATRCSWVNSSSGCCGRLPQSSFRTEALFGKR